jgi:hypothetical protein
MNLELFNHELEMLYQALSYANTEAETAEFAMLKVKVNSAIVKEQQNTLQKKAHDKMNCIFKYCNQNPKCE